MTVWNAEGGAQDVSDGGINAPCGPCSAGMVPNPQRSRSDSRCCVFPYVDTGMAWAENLIKANSANVPGVIPASSWIPGVPNWAVIAGGVAVVVVVAGMRDPSSRSRRSKR